MNDVSVSMKDVVLKWAQQNDVVLTLADGFEAAIQGVGRQFSHHVVVYDREMCITILTADMSREEAEEYFEFNVVGSFVGETTPVFLERLDV